VTRPTITVGIPTFNRAALLRETIESVLGQTYRDFSLIVSDNASTDETRDVVASLADSRLQYVRAEENVGMIGNFNRLIGLAGTEFLMLLPDDDRLYPEYLGSVVEILQQNPSVGAVHTAFDEIDAETHVQKHGVSYVTAKDPPLVEPGHAFLERSMTSTPILFASTAYRTRAIRDAQGMTTREEPFADVPLFMRIALKWDFAYVDRPLAAFRVHDASVTKQLAPGGERASDERDRLLTYGQIMFDRRIGFLDGAGLKSETTSRYRALATLRFVADRAGLGCPWWKSTTDFARLLSLYPRIVVHPLAIRFCAAHLGGRSLRRAAQRVRSR